MLACFLLSVAVLWWIFALLVLRNVWATPRLPASGDLPQPAQPPRVSVVVAARDEAERIEATVRGLLAQQQVELELIVVDDRSTDATPEILSRLAAEDARVQVVRVDALPAGWLGKCHACRQGAAQATGPWLLFADGDIHMRPDLLARAVATAERDQAQHLCLWPAINCTGALTRASILAWGQCLAAYAPAAQINRDRGRRAVGIGAFNLVRADAYRAIGGHELLKMEVVDDIKLGLLLRRAGCRQRLYAGFDDLEAEWAHGTAQVVKAVEKNWFAGAEYSLVRAATVLIGFSLLVLGGLSGPLLDPLFGWAALSGLLAPILPALFQTRLARWPAWIALLVPLGFITFIWAGTHSTLKTLRQGGIRWRDTFYPLSDLRAGVVK